MQFVIVQKDGSKCRRHIQGWIQSCDLIGYPFLQVSMWHMGLLIRCQMENNRLYFYDICIFRCCKVPSIMLTWAMRGLALRIVGWITASRHDISTNVSDERWFSNSYSGNGSPPSINAWRTSSKVLRAFITSIKRCISQRDTVYYRANYSSL